MNSIKHTEKLNQIELDNQIPFSASWHQEFSSSSSIYIGGLPYNLTEGDIIQIFSQYGEVIDIDLQRDKETGKSKGFCFLWYEDQKSTVLAVDNFNGAEILDRIIRVDHHLEKKEKQKRRLETDEEFHERISRRRELVMKDVGLDYDLKKKKKILRNDHDKEDPMADYLRKKSKGKKKSNTKD